MKGFNTKQSSLLFIEELESHPKWSILDAAKQADVRWATEFFCLVCAPKRVDIICGASVFRKIPVVLWGWPKGDVTYSIQTGEWTFVTWRPCGNVQIGELFLSAIQFYGADFNRFIAKMKTL